MTVVTKDTTETRHVVLGVSGDGMVEITSGLTAGELVAIADLLKPLPGLTLRPMGATSSATPGGVRPGGPSVVPTNAPQPQPTR